MQDDELTRQELAVFVQLATLPRTFEVMDELGQSLAFNFDHPARVFLEIAANQLGIDKDRIDAFHEWWAFDRDGAA
jgi:hypothetical protein